MKKLLACGALIWLACLSACGGAQHPSEREPVAELRMIVVPENALIEVNERSIGSARVLSKRPAQLKTGKKRITITAPGYFPHDLEVDLREGETKIEVKLVAVPR